MNFEKFIKDVYTHQEKNLNLNTFASISFQFKKKGTNNIQIDEYNRFVSANYTIMS